VVVDVRPGHRWSRRPTNTGVVCCATAPKIATATIGLDRRSNARTIFGAREGQQRLEVDDHLRRGRCGERGSRSADRSRLAQRNKHGEVLPMGLAGPRCRPVGYVAASHPQRPTTPRWRSTTTTRERWPRSVARAAVGQVGPLRFRGLPGLDRLARRAPSINLIGFREPLPRAVALVLVLLFRSDRPIRVVIRANTWITTEPGFSGVRGRE